LPIETETSRIDADAPYRLWMPTRGRREATFSRLIASESGELETFI
jgi:hypothetical protein